MPPRSNPQAEGGEGGLTPFPLSPAYVRNECKWFKQGNCRFGERCKFLHSASQVSTTGSSMAMPNVSMEPAVSVLNIGTSEATASRLNSLSANGRTPRMSVNLLLRGTPSNMPNATNPITPVVLVNGINGQPSLSQNAKKIKPCFAWQKGHCLRGSSCPYNHDPKIAVTSCQSLTNLVQSQSPNQESSASLVAAVSRAPPTAECIQSRLGKQQSINKQFVSSPPSSSLYDGPQKPCHSWRNHTCTNGDQCQYKHEGESGAQRKLAEAQRAVQQLEALQKEEERQRQENARRIAAERLERERAAHEREMAEACRIAERIARERQSALRQLEERRTLEAQSTLQTLVKESNLVTFGPGLDIRRVIPGFALCKIIIRDLPTDATQLEISDIFREQGLDDTMFKLVRCRREANAQVAEFLMQKETAQAMAVGLEGFEFRDNFLAFEVGANALWGSMSSAIQANDPKTLTVFWNKPSATMIATYDTVEATRRKAQELDRHFLRGRHISASLNTRPNGPAARYWVETSIRLGNLDPGTTLDEIQTIAGSYMVRSVKSNAYDLDMFIELMKRSMEDQRCISGSFKTNSLNSNRMKASMQFLDREEIERAAQRLGRPLLHNGPRLQVVRPAAHHYTINIPNLQYRAQKAQWDAMTEAARGQSAFVRINEGGNGLVYINVQGSEHGKVGPLKVRVEGLVAGERLDGDHWHSTFRHAGPGLPVFQRVKRKTGVLVSVDRRFHALRLFGSSGNMPTAKQIIRQEVDRLALTECQIPIARKSVRFFVATGLQVLKESLGDDNVTLDVASQQCKLKLRGGDDAIQHARKLIEEAVATSDVGLPLGNEAEEGEALCPICYDNATHPEVLVCGHSYCEPCFRHYIASAAGSNNFPLVCMGNDATCRTPIAIPVIQRYLTEHKFSRLIDTVFDAHIQSNARKFKYCTTPDCTQIYQCDTGQLVHQCPSCFSKICSSCDREAHEGMTCEQRRIQDHPTEQDRLNDEWARSNNIKRCPSCNVLTEKTEGCNHMECRCGVHFCWICMRVFPGNQIYRHMNDAHGGIYNADPAAAAAGQHQVNGGQAQAPNELEEQWLRQWDDMVHEEQLDELEEEERLQAVAQQWLEQAHEGWRRAQDLEQQLRDQQIQRQLVELARAERQLQLSEQERAERQRQELERAEGQRQELERAEKERQERAITERQRKEELHWQRRIQRRIAERERAERQKREEERQLQLAEQARAERQRQINEAWRRQRGIEMNRQRELQERREQQVFATNVARWEAAEQKGCCCVIM